MAKKGKFQQPRTSAAQQHVNKAAGKKKKKQKKGVAVLAVLSVVLTLALVAAVGVYAYGRKLVDGKSIYPNVRVAGVEVGGMTQSEALEAVNKAVADSFSASSLEVRLPDRTLSFEPEQTKVALDADAAIEEAMAFGRSEGVFRAVVQYLKSENYPRDIQLETAVNLDTDYIESLIHQTAAAVDKAPRNSSIGMNKDMTEVQLQKGSTGRKLDTDGLYEAVHQAFVTGNFEPITWEYELLDYQTVNPAELHVLLEEQIADAYYDAENHEIVEGISGYTFDLDAAVAGLADAEEGAQLSFPIVEKLPELTAEQLREEMFGTVLEKRSSWYVNNPNRTENLRLACEAINGTIINPDEVFSFNEIVGERTAEKGYKPATIYGGEGESVDDLGGGVCQVASTIYYAVLYLDLKTVMREPHMYEVTYVPASCDAAIFWDSGLDYKFRNTLQNPIMIEANIDGGTCNITFYGVKENDNYVVLSAPEYLETWEEEDVEEVDETKPEGYRELKQTSYTGAKTKVVKKVYDGDGNLLRSVDLNSTYKARPKIYIVGPSAEEPVDPEIPEEPVDPETPIDPEHPDENGEVTAPDWEDYWP